MWQLATRLCIPGFGFFTLFLLSGDEQAIVVYDLLVTLGPLLIAVVFAPNIHLFGYERARSVGGKSNSISRLRDKIVLKLVGCALFTSLVISWVAPSYGSFFITGACLVPFFAFLVLRTVQTPLLVYRRRSKPGVGWIELFFAVCLVFIIGTHSIARSGLEAGLPAAIGVASIAAMAIMRPAFPESFRLFRLSLIAKSPNSVNRASLNLRWEDWLPTLIFCFSVCTLNLDRFIFVILDGKIDITNTIFVMRIAAFLSGLMIFSASITVSPKIYGMTRAGDIVGGFSAVRSSELRFLVVLSLLIGALYTLWCIFEKEFGFPADLGWIAVLWVKAVVALVLNFSAIRCTAVGARADLTILYAMAAAIMVAVSVLFIGLGLSFVFCSILCSAVLIFLCFLFDFLVARKYASCSS